MVSRAKVKAGGFLDQGWQVRMCDRKEKYGSCAECRFSGMYGRSFRRGDGKRLIQTWGLCARPSSSSIGLHSHSLVHQWRKSVPQLAIGLWRVGIALAGAARPLGSACCRAVWVAKSALSRKEVWHVGSASAGRRGHRACLLLSWSHGKLSLGRKLCGTAMVYKECVGKAWSK